MKPLVQLAVRLITYSYRTSCSFSKDQLLLTCSNVFLLPFSICWCKLRNDVAKRWQNICRIII